MRRMIVLGVLVAAGLAAAGWWLLARMDDSRMLEPVAAAGLPATFVVEPGSTLTAVSRELAAAGLLEHPAGWVRVARREGVAGRIHAGEYHFPRGATPRSVLDMLVEGRVRMHSVTLLEGWTFDQALQAVQGHPAVAVTLAAASGEQVMDAVGAAGRHPEGMLFPDTYLFARGTTDVELLRQAHERLLSELEFAWRARDPALPLKDAYEALILASIVEKETGIAEERPVIAGVFVNRLRRGMRLQTDPTVIYGMGERFDGNIRRADLARDTPYNTYTRAGLPPTPIALVGQGALRAAVRPAATDALYFVATGRGDGRHLFARTLTEHNDNVARYLATLRGAAKEGAH